jgi:hypothetical protein
VGSLFAQIVRSRWMPLVLLAGVLVLAASPASAGPHSLSVTRLIPPCLFKRLTGLPCPGCGLTRGLVCMAHGDVAGAALLNPLALLLFPAFVALALAAVLPAPLRLRLSDWIEARERLFNLLGIGAGVALLANGVGRIIWILCLGHPSIW